MPQLLLAAYYGHGSGGDEAILASLLPLLNAAVGDLQVSVVSGNPSGTRLAHGVDTVADTDIPALVEAVAKVDAVVPGGGGLVHDYWDVDNDVVFLIRRHGGLVATLAYPAPARLFGKPTILGAVGIGPLTTECRRHLTGIIAELARIGTVRDDASLSLLREVSGAPRAEGGFGSPLIQHFYCRSSRGRSWTVCSRKPAWTRMNRSWAWRSGLGGFHRPPTVGRPKARTGRGG